MKKLITLITFLLALNANAGLINIDIVETNIDNGDSIAVTINALNFDETDMFDFDFVYDNLIFAYQASSLTSGLNIFDNQAPWLGLEVVERGFGLSFDFWGDILAPVDGSFTIASFNLTATNEGASTFNVRDFYSFGAFDDYDVTFSNSSAVSVSSAAQAVPEPSSIAIMMIAGLALFTSRKKLANKKVN
jgi:hypothetical protein